MPTVETHDVLLGTERLTLTAPDGAVEGGGTLSVVRADGVPAVGPAGSDGIPFRVLKP